MRRKRRYRTAVVPALLLLLVLLYNSPMNLPYLSKLFFLQNRSQYSILFLTGQLFPALFSVSCALLFSWHGHAELRRLTEPQP